jgi:hypothetical protein
MHNSSKWATWVSSPSEGWTDFISTEPSHGADKVSWSICKSNW